MELGWVDYSDSDRIKALGILSALHEPTAIDELGFGIIRDAFANYFFPGTSTLLTHAKYFFLVPYALRDMERQDNRRSTPASLRRSYDETERRVAIRLLKGNSNRHGIVGVRSLSRGNDYSGPWVKRGPAIIYWSPLKQLEFLRNSEMSYVDYFRYAARCSGDENLRASAEYVDNGWNDDDLARGSVWNIPSESYSCWQDNDSIQLTSDEASFLARRIQEGRALSGTLFSILVSNPDVLAAARGAFDPDHALNAEGAIDEEVAAGGFHAFCSLCKANLPSSLVELCNHAIAFSNFVYGCRIRYNAILFNHEEEVEGEWESYSERQRDYAGELDIDEIYRLLDIDRHVGAAALREFLKDAKELMSNADVDGLDECIRRREREIKGGKSKIGREEGLPDGWRGGRRLSYRFEVAASLAFEIQDAGGLDV